MSIEKRRPPSITIFLWIVGVLTLVLTGYGIFTGVVLASYCLISHILQKIQQYPFKIAMFLSL